jgi:hypothetical protein
MRSLINRTERISKKLLEANRLPPYERCFLDDELDELLNTTMENKLTKATMYLALVRYQSQIEKELVKFNMARFLEYIARDSVPGRYYLDTDVLLERVYEYILTEDLDFEERLQMLSEELGLPKPNFDQDDIHSNLLWFRSIAAEYIHDMHVFKLSVQEYMKKRGLDHTPWNSADDIEW